MVVSSYYRFNGDLWDVRSSGIVFYNPTLVCASLLVSDLSGGFFGMDGSFIYEAL